MQRNSLFHRATFGTFGHPQNKMIATFFYEGDEPICRVSCPARFEMLFGPMLRINGGERVGDDRQGDMQPTRVFYHVSFGPDLRESIARFRTILTDRSRELDPVEYVYATDANSPHELHFIEKGNGPLQVIAVLSCPNRVIAPWVQAVRSSGMVTVISPGQNEFEFTLTLAHNVGGDDKRLGVYESLAGIFHDLLPNNSAD